MNTLPDCVKVSDGYYWLYENEHWRKIVSVDAAGWDDYTSPIDVKPNSVFAPDWAQMFGRFGGYRFGANTQARFQSTFHIRHDFVPNSPIFFHVHWTDCSIKMSGDVAWQFQYSAAKGHGQQAFFESPVFEMRQACLGSRCHMIAECPVPIVGDFLEPDTLVLVHASRIGTSSGDTCKNDVFGLTSDFHYLSTSHATLNRFPPFYE